MKEVIAKALLFPLCIKAALTTKGIKKSWFFNDTYARCLTLKHLPNLKWW